MANLAATSAGFYTVSRTSVGGNALVSVERDAAMSLDAMMTLPFVSAVSVPEQRKLMADFVQDGRFDIAFAVGKSNH